MIAVGEHAPASTERAIEALREADAEALQAARERALALRFDDKVHVVSLRGPLNDPHAEPTARRAEGSHDHLHAALRSKARHVASEAQRDVDRRSPVEPRTSRRASLDARHVFD